MMAAWMLYSLIVGALVAVAAYAADRSCRLLHLPGRWVWLTALLATSLLSVRALVRIATAAADQPVGTPAAGTVLVSDLAPTTGLPRVLEALLGLGRGMLATAGAFAARGYEAVAASTAGAAASPALLLTWGLGTAVLLLIMAVTLLRIWRARGGWRAHRIAGVPVFVSRDFGPAVVGLLRPAIVAPAWLLAESPERQRLVVQHEDEHRRARDPLLLAAACLTACLLPWNLAMWWLLRRMRLALELDCDARVLRRGATPLSYGTALLEIAGRSPARAMGAPALIDSRIHLERRLLAMSETTRTFARSRAAAAGLAAVLIGMAACGTDVPTATAVEDLDVQAARQQVERAGLLQSADGKAPLFFVDGAEASEAVASALVPEDIASIQVLKGEAATKAFGARGAEGVVHVLTREVAAAQVAGELAVTGYAATEGKPKVRSTGPVTGSAEAGPGVRIRTGAVVVEGTRLRSVRPLMVVDGNIAAETFDLRSIPAESIEQVEVLKAEAAVGRFGERGANGVILITTKRGGRQ